MFLVSTFLDVPPFVSFHATFTNMVPCSETFLRTSVVRKQAERIVTALACPDESRDVQALVTEDNLVEYGWISTWMELDLD